MAKDNVDIRVQHPLEPWLWRADWAEGRIQSGNRAQVMKTWVVATLWMALSSPVIMAFPNQWAKGNMVFAFALIFPLIGLFILAGAIQLTFRWLKFGRSTLRLLTIPGQVGGALNGAIEVPVKVAPRAGFKLRLICEERTSEGYGKDRSVKKDLIWEQEKVIQKDLLAEQGQRTGIPVYFQIPAELPQTKGGNPDIIWRLEATAELPGVNYKSEFEVPVFDTGHSQPDVASDPTLAYQPKDEADPAPLSSKIRVRDVPEGVEVYFAAARNPGPIAVLAGLSGVCSLLLWLSLAKHASVNVIVGLGCVDLLLYLVLATTLFYTVRVVAGRSGITIYHHMLVPLVTRRVPPHLIQGIIAKPLARVGKETIYDLQVRTLTGQTYNAGYAIPTKRYAESLADKLRASTLVIVCAT